MRYAAIIFDLDGVILDSEGLHAEAKRITLDHFGLTFEEKMLHEFKGRPDTVFFSHVSDALAKGRWTAQELNDFKYQAYRKLSNRMEVIPGALDFLAAAREQFPLMGLVSSARLRDVKIAYRKYGLKSWFDVIILGDDTVNHKPHSEPYVTTLKRMDLTADRVIVIEDSPNGVISATGAGCDVIGLTTGFSIPDLAKAGAGWTAGSYEDIARILTMVHPPA